MEMRSARKNTDMSETKGAEQFSARDSALGYLYQVRLALLWSLKRLASDDFNVGLETLDDVVFESEGRPTDVLQAKHSVKRVASLTDTSPDIWKTFRVWLTALRARQIDVSTRRILVSTGISKDDAAAYFLRDAEERSEEKALTLLNAAARSSTSSTNEEGYALFLALSEQEKLAFLKCVVIMDAAPVATEVEQELRLVLHLSVPKRRIAGAIEALEGWWFAQTVRQLSSPGGRLTLASRAIELKLDDIRDQCRADTLLVDDEILGHEFDQEALSSYTGRTFSKQVSLVTKHSTRLKLAITDYYRASTQRSRWLRDNLLLASDDERFRQNLFEAWQVRFAQLQDAVEDDTNDASKAKAGAKLLSWAENDAECSLNTGVDAPWMARGTLHELSGAKLVGWHPDYDALLDDAGSTKGEAK